MKKNEALKKHHFWLLLGAVPLFTLIGALVVDSSVGGAIADRQKKLDDANKKIAPKLNPKPAAVIKQAEKLVATVSSKQGGLHQYNWDRQKNLFTWPASSRLLKEVEYGEANIEKAADRVIEAGLPANLPPAERAAKVKEARDELAKLTPLERTAKLKEMLNQLPLTPDQRKALLEPAWPKFGDPLPNDRGEFDEFRKSDVYVAQFSSLKKGQAGPGTGMADRVAPTQFRGGWQAVLRHVNDFGPGQITKDQVWLMMEDIWAQRSMLSAVRAVNEEMAAFRRAKLDKDGNAAVDRSFDEAGNKVQLGANGQPVLDKRTGRPLAVPTPEAEKRKGVFASRTWALELEVVREGSSQRLTGRLRNLTDRLQLLGVGNIMTLNVWFRNSAQPMAFKIGGEYVAGKGATKVVRVPVLGPDGKPQRDAEGREKTTEKTVPDDVLAVVPTDDHILPAGVDPNAELLRVEQVFDIRTVPVKRIDALVLGYTDSRNAAAVLQPPQSPPFAKEPEVAPPTDPAAASGEGVAPAPPVPMPARPGPAFGPGGAPLAGKGQPAGGGPISAVIDGNKKRYLIASSEVRRVPVGVVLVVDQSLIQDVLLAFANSPLRFQITQVGWTAFTDKLDGTTPVPSSGGEGGVDFGSGTVTFGGSGDPDLRPGGRFGPGPFPRPAGVGPMSPAMGPGGSPYGRTGSTVSESQVTSGLVELSIYGVMSLYEKYEAPKADAAAAGGPNPAPAPAAPAPGKPMPAAPTTKVPPPGPRRRARK